MACAANVPHFNYEATLKSFQIRLLKVRLVFQKHLEFTRRYFVRIYLELANLFSKVI